MTIKHSDGTEYVLCPKVATEEMLDSHYESGCDGGDDQYQWMAACEAAPPYEPADEVVERVARAIANGYWKEPPYNDLHTDAGNNHWRSSARAAISAFIGSEG